MKKRIRNLAAAVAVGVVLSGCTLPEESLGELLGVSTAPAATVAPETVPMAEPTEAPVETPTESPTEPAALFEQGQQIWAVYRHEGGVGLRRFFVVALEGDVVIVTTAVPGSGEAGELLSFPAADCYGDSTDAWEAAGMEPIE